MPSLEVLDGVEQSLGLPVISAATASVWALLQRLRIEPRIRGAGWLLRNAIAPRPAEAVPLRHAARKRGRPTRRAATLV